MSYTREQVERAELMVEKSIECYERVIKEDQEEIDFLSEDLPNPTIRINKAKLRKGGLSQKEAEELTEIIGNAEWDDMEKRDRIGCLKKQQRECENKMAHCKVIRQVLTEKLEEMKR